MIPTVITAHVRRREWAEGLRRQFPGSVVCWDSGRPDKEHARINTASSIVMVATAGWIARLGDDAIPVRNLAVNMERIIATAPKDARMLSFYSNRKEDRMTQAKGQRWRRKRKHELFPALLLAVRDGVELAAYLLAHDGHWDTLAGGWADANGHAAYFHVPSLVQHRNEGSLLGHPARPGGIERRSRTFPGAAFDAGML